MRKKISVAVVNGSIRVVKGYKGLFESGNAALAASETPTHAQSNIRKKCAHQRKHRVVAAETSTQDVNFWPISQEQREREQRRAAFYAMPRKEYKQTYIQ